MSQEIVLFHSALGLGPAVRQFAMSLKAAGHVVYTPDLYDGATFDSLEDGTRRRDELGVAEIMKRAYEAVEYLPPELIYVGFSMGAAAAEYLAATRAGAKAAVLISGAPSPAMAGILSWPKGVHVQVHYAMNDAEPSRDEVDALADAVRRGGSRIEVFSYRTGGHFFFDERQADYSRESAWLLAERVREFTANHDLADGPTAETPAFERPASIPHSVEASDMRARMGDGVEPGGRAPDERLASGDG